MAYHCFGEVSIHVLDKLKEACDLEGGKGRREVGYRVTIHMNDHFVLLIHKLQDLSPDGILGVRVWFQDYVECCIHELCEPHPVREPHPLQTFCSI